MFISRKALADILERLERLETIVAASTGVDKKRLSALVAKHGTKCVANPNGNDDHSISGFRTGPGGYCRYCGATMF